MGHRINPISFRLGSYRGWEGQWYGDYEYSILLTDDLLIKNYLNGMAMKLKMSKGNPFIKRWSSGFLQLTIPLYHSNSLSDRLFNISEQKQVLRDFVKSTQLEKKKFAANETVLDALDKTLSNVDNFNLIVPSLRFDIVIDIIYSTLDSSVTTFPYFYYISSFLNFNDFYSKNRLQFGNLKLVYSTKYLLDTLSVYAELKNLDKRSIECAPLCFNFSQLEKEKRPFFPRRGATYWKFSPSSLVSKRFRLRFKWRGISFWPGYNIWKCRIHTFNFVSKSIPTFYKNLNIRQLHFFNSFFLKKKRLGYQISKSYLQNYITLYNTVKLSKVSFRLVNPSGQFTSKTENKKFFFEFIKYLCGFLEDIKITKYFFFKILFSKFLKRVFSNNILPFSPTVINKSYYSKFLKFVLLSCIKFNFENRNILTQKSNFGKFLRNRKLKKFILKPKSNKLIRYLQLKDLVLLLKRKRFSRRRARKRFKRFFFNKKKNRKFVRKYKRRVHSLLLLRDKFKLRQRIFFFKKKKKFLFRLKYYKFNRARFNNSTFNRNKSFHDKRIYSNNKYGSTSSTNRFNNNYSRRFDSFVSVSKI